ncbi:hypothetical protein NKH47_31020, partial [Mesorhizobium sp. M1060]
RNSGVVASRAASTFADRSSSPWRSTADCRRQATPPCFNEDRAERTHNALDHGKRSILRQFVSEGVGVRRVELRELSGADQRHDVDVDVLGVGIARRALQAFGVASFQPQLRCLFDRDRGAVCDMNAELQVTSHLYQIGVGILALVELFGAAIAAGIEVVCQPANSPEGRVRLRT